VVVRSREGLTYACRFDAETGWRCGRCEDGVIPNPQVGRTCPACAAEVIATRRGLGIGLIVFVILTLVLGWVALTWWR
jgi:hypothetical protein